MTARHCLRFPGTLVGFEEASQSLQGLLDARGLDRHVRYNVELAFEEIAVNIIRHGRPRAEVEVAMTFDDDIVMTFEDDGGAFDPRAQPTPTVPESMDEARVGGLGLSLVRRVCTRMHYERTPQHRNRLTVALPAR